MIPFTAGRVIRMMVASSAFLALTSCNSDDAVSPNAPAACTGNVTVTVTSGTTPTFSWTPACSIAAVVVEEGAADQWDVFANGDPGFGPSVIYGTKPAGSNQNSPAIPLRAGTTYNVTLFRGPLAIPVVNGIMSFTP